MARKKDTPEKVPALNEHAAAHEPWQQIKEVFGPPPLLDGESIDSYNALRDQLRAAVNPVDVVDELFVNDLVYFAWESCRLRRHKGNLHRSFKREGLEALLTFHGVTDDLMNELAEGWMEGDPEEIKRVEEFLADVGPVNELIAAHALRKNMSTFERIDEMITRADACRNAVLREFDRHDAARAARVRFVVEAEDAEFTEVAPTPSQVAA